MQRKIRQVTDNVHETIYLSELESKLMSTPYFYRLHDIYQSSTVYLTFPSNRTKRYEHSLGTMELASQIFFSAFSKANTADKTALLDELYEYVNHICGEMEHATNENIGYLQQNKTKINEIFSEDFFKHEEFEKKIPEIIKNDILSDSALEHYAVCFFDCLDDSTKDETGQVAKYLYVYQAILEAIRISALFHDVGHPPYSHIIETVLLEIYNECILDVSRKAKKYNSERREDLIRNLEKYISIDEKESVNGSFFLIKQEMTDIEMHLHEKVGIRMLQLAIEEVFSSILCEICDSEDCTERASEVFYYITVIEFTFAILFEKANIFKSLHRIIDGIIDADRLDYVVRDSKNAGVDWGKIPYKRIVDSAVLTRPIEAQKDFFAVTYPEKLKEDIEDILLLRYKIFARINFHHRSVKTATLLQNAVKELAFDFLCSEKGGAISEEIHDLWAALGSTWGSQALKVIQWNDSWLITVLYGALVKLSTPNTYRKLCKVKSEEMVLRCKNLIDEVLLNHKIYHSVLKRKQDVILLINDAFEQSDIKSKFVETRIAENQKLLSATNNSEAKAKANEALDRLDLIEKVLTNGDIELFHVILPTLNNPIEIINKVLADAKGEGSIDNYYVLTNDGRNKMGLPRIDGDASAQVYLHDKDGRAYKFDASDSVKPQIATIRASSLFFHVYVKPGVKKDIPYVLSSIKKMFAKEFGNQLSNTYNELFPSK